MNSLTKIQYFKHFLGIGTVGGIYISQIVHIGEFIGFTIISLVYMYSLFAYYSILYGVESKLLNFSNHSSRGVLTNFRVIILVVGAVLTILTFYIQNKNGTANNVQFIFQALFRLFQTLFPEFLLPLIFGIKVDC